MNHLTIIEVAYVAKCQTCDARVDSRAWPDVDQSEVEAAQEDLEENHGWKCDRCGACAKVVRDESYDERTTDED